MPVVLEPGKYTPDHSVTVYSWPKPDANGDGDEIYKDETDENGNVYARNLVTDEQGNPVRRYAPPDGFANKQSFDGSENYVLVDKRGLPVRHNGRAVPIREGQSVVISASNEVSYLNDDYSRAQFLKSHSQVD